MSTDPDQMYRWRRLTPAQRAAVLEHRKTHSKPWHSPPHYESYDSTYYVLNNAVHHGFVTKWSDWPYSNAAEYLQTIGREQALRIWKSYPLFDYGKDWDAPEL